MIISAKGTLNLSSELSKTSRSATVLHNLETGIQYRFPNYVMTLAQPCLQSMLLKSEITGKCEQNGLCSIPLSSSQMD